MYVRKGEKAVDAAEASFGKKPDVYYRSGDMGAIRAWSGYLRQGEDGYIVDGVTWHNLDTNQVFRHINTSLSTPGKQVLYDTLHHPTLSKVEYRSRERLIAFMEAEPEKRLDVQVKLDKLGRTRRSDLYGVSVGAQGAGAAVPVIAILAALVVSIVLTAAGTVNITTVVIIFAFIPWCGR